MDLSTLQYWLARFVLEVRKQNVLEYPPNTLHHLVCGIMLYLRQSGNPKVNFFKGCCFCRLSYISWCQNENSSSIGSKRKQAKPLTLEEKQLWNKKVLGDHNPHALLNTMIFMVGMYFALRSGDEHRQIHHSPCQFSWLRNPVKGHIYFIQKTGLKITQVG